MFKFIDRKKSQFYVKKSLCFSGPMKLFDTDGISERIFRKSLILKIIRQQKSMVKFQGGKELMLYVCI